jgi:hypothetical protein
MEVCDGGVRREDVRQSPERERRVPLNPALDFDELSRVALGALMS